MRGARHLSSAAGPSCASRTRSLVKGALGAFVSLIAPSECRLCGDRLLQYVDYPVCDRCLAGLSPLRQEMICGRCSEPLAPDSLLYLERQDQRSCARCLENPPRFVRATAFGLYDDLREAIHLLKFQGVHSLAKPLGDMLAHAILLQRAGAPSSLAVVPVPLYRGKRSHNQSELLAKAALQQVQRASPEWNLELRSDLLRRVRRTESQYLLSPHERSANLRHAFRAEPKVRGHDVLLVDDVYTTGTTAHECTRTLLAAGARSVRVATLARAGRDTATMWFPSIPPQPVTTPSF